MSTIRVKKLNEEVFFSEDPIVELTKSDLSWLKDLAQKNRRETIRLCAHQTTDDPIHEMFIAHSKKYLRPSS